MRHYISDSGSDIAAAVDDEIVVRLGEMSSSGYQWQLPDTVPDGLAVFDVEQPAAGSSAVGAQQVRQIGFRVVASGHHVVSLRQFRAWEGPSHSIATFSFAVRS